VRDGGEALTLEGKPLGGGGRIWPWDMEAGIADMEIDEAFLARVCDIGDVAVLDAGVFGSARVSLVKVVPRRLLLVIEFKVIVCIAIMY